MPEEAKLSKVEHLKESSRQLRGTIAEELASDNPEFSHDAYQLLKHHGTYQQDDRDNRALARKEGRDKDYQMMVRTAATGGKVSSQQMLTQLDLCDELGNSTLKITTRQAFQTHGVLKRNLRETIHRITAAQMSTLAACGDVNRNVVCCPAKIDSPARRAMQTLADDIALALRPQTAAYYELWVKDPDTGEETLAASATKDEVVEPIYGPTYLPRKFKVGIALPEDNCVDVYANDLGYLAVVRDGQVIGYNVSVGGGMGTVPSAKKSFPALAKKMAFVTPEQAVDVGIAVVKVQRDYGNREDRKVARLKYLIAERGVEWFREQVEQYYGSKLQDPAEDDVHKVDLHHGWFEQGDGLWSYGLNVENGRLYDNDKHQLKAGIRAICHELSPPLRLTAYQSLLICDIRPEDRDRVTEILRQHSVPLSEDTTEIRLHSIACVALPTCGLAVTESERVLPGVIDQLEAPLAQLGLDHEQFSLRMTGCPNGCGRPYNADVSFVGKTKGKYTMFVGGTIIGHRMAYLYKDMVPFEEIVAETIGVFRAFAKNRQDGETLGDFCHRVGADQLAELAAAGE